MKAGVSVIVLRRHLPSFIYIGYVAVFLMVSFLNVATAPKKNGNFACLK